MARGTERPTRRRIERALREGDVAISAAFTQAAASVVVVVLAPSALRALGTRFTELFRDALRAGAVRSAGEMASELVLLSAPLLFAAASVSALVALLQRGRITIVPLRASAASFSGQARLSVMLRLWNGARGLVMVAFVVAAALWILADAAPRAAGTAGGSPSSALAMAAQVTTRLAWTAALGFFAVGAIDFAILRADWLARLKMTRDEIRREQREGEGDPELRRVRRSAHEQLSRQSMPGAVEHARLVVCDASGRAIALRFDASKDEAPWVLVSGAGARAREIVRIAAARRIRILDDRALADQLFRIAEGDPIPKATYDAVARAFHDE